MNAYGYSGGDPVTYSDPFGLCCFLPMVGDAGAGIIASAIADEQRKRIDDGAQNSIQLMQALITLPLLIDGGSDGSLMGETTQEDATAASAATETSTDAIGIGPYAGESIPARSAARDFDDAERAQMNRIGSKTGCHTCGARNPGTKSGNFVLDHQPATALNKSGGPQRLYPHCVPCSRNQGLAIARKLKEGSP